MENAPKKLKIFLYKSGVLNEGIFGSVISYDNPDTKAYKTKEDKLKKQSYRSYIIDNVPRSGYKITSYSYKDVRRVIHPDGFSMCISESSVNEITMNCTIINGVVQDELFFDNNLIPIHENMRRFKLAEKKRLREIQQKKDASELTAGDYIEFERWGSREKFIFCGKFHVLRKFKTETTLVFVFKRAIGGEIFYRTNLNGVMFTRQPSSLEIDRTQILKEFRTQFILSNREKICNTSYKDPYAVDNCDDIYGMFDKKTRIQDMKIEFVDVDRNKLLTNSVTGHYCSLCVCASLLKLDGEWVIGTYTDPYRTYYSSTNAGEVGINLYKNSAGWLSLAAPKKQCNELFPVLSSSEMYNSYVISKSVDGYKKVGFETSTTIQQGILKHKDEQ